jgi:hypothetical protein
MELFLLHLPNAFEKYNNYKYVSENHNNAPVINVCDVAYDSGFPGTDSAYA